MRKIQYRATNIKEINAQVLCQRLCGERLVVGIDVAKEALFAAFADETGGSAVVVRWKQPAENADFVRLVKGVSGPRTAEMVMEPTGTYGDALREQLMDAGFSVFRIQPKRTHDAAELYDGVPSMHDAKAASLLVKLHLSGVSERWSADTEAQRQAKAALVELQLYRKQFEANRNRLSALLSRYFPELGDLLLMRSVTLLEVMSHYGGPEAIAKDEAGVRALMRQVGGRLLSEAKMDAVIHSARGSIGVRQLPQEQALVRTVAREARRNQKEVHVRERALRMLAKKHPAAQQLSKVAGRVTASVLLAVSGEPSSYSSAKAYLKSFGLNLKERSSGQLKGRLRITKRGSGLGRAYLYMMALRYIYRNSVVRGWYATKVARQGEQAKIKAVVAVMRKLVLALWHVARGQSFDAHKLFDTRRRQGVAASTRLISQGGATTT
jgi:transposase